MHIVVVVESATNRRIIRNALQLIGHTDVTACEDSEQAIEHMTENRVDVLILGKKLPDTRGTKLSNNIRRSNDLSHIPILMVGYQFTEEDVLHAVDRGIDSFLLMPFSPEALQDKIASMTETIRN